MKRPGYRQALQWLAMNDNCGWLTAGPCDGVDIAVSAEMVRDLWEVTDEKLFFDLRNVMKNYGQTHQHKD